MTEPNYPRDLRGYGRNPPDPKWPGQARIAVQFVVNFEEGGENNILHGDRASEAFLSDVLGAQPWPGQRHPNIESMFEYGSRAGFWRLWRMFTERNMPATVFGVATALQRNPEVVAAMQEAGWDIASHSLKWIEHKDMSEAEERWEIAEAIRVHTEATGQRPRGWYTGRSSINTLRLLMEAGSLLYLYLPVVGPTTLRDGFGSVVSLLGDPVSQATGGPSTDFAASRSVLRGLNTRADGDDTLRTIMGQSTDPYATVQSGYLQSRAAFVREATGAEEALPDFDSVEPQAETASIPALQPSAEPAAPPATQP